MLSWLLTIGLAAGQCFQDREAIAAHLEAVERELRSKDVSHLPRELRLAREQNLARLRDYRLQARFPTNTEHPDRCVPYFIDDHGVACAVGQLIIDSGERPLAE